MAVSAMKDTLTLTGETPVPLGGLSPLGALGKDIMPILLVGLNHQTASLSLRERVSVVSNRLPARLRELSDVPGIREAVILSTCNRTECYIIGENPQPVIAFLAESAGVSVDELRQYLYIHLGRQAVRHLFRVACGLDSLAIGETQILGQVREAWRMARKQHAAGRELCCIFQQAVATGKRARSETAISEGAFSIGRAAVELANALYPDLGSANLLVLGAGKIAELTAKHLSDHGAGTILVANRTLANANELAARLGGRAIPYEELGKLLPEIDILISSTSAPHIVLHAEVVAHAMAGRPDRPLCLIDLAVPRDVDPAVVDIPNVHLYNIDDLQEITAPEHHRRVAEIPRVETIIAEEVVRCCHRQAGLQAAPLLTALRNTFEEARRAELARAATVLATLTPEQQRAVEYLTSAMLNKILHTPTVRIKEVLARGEDHLPLAALCDLFGLEDVGKTGVEEE